MNSSNFLTAAATLGAIIATLTIIGLILAPTPKLPISQPIPKTETNSFDGFGGYVPYRMLEKSPQEIQASVERKNAEVKPLGDYCRSKGGTFFYYYGDGGFPGYYAYMLGNQCSILGKDDIVRVYRVEDYNGGLKLTERNT